VNGPVTTHRTDGPASGPGGPPDTWFLSPRCELRGWGTAAIVEVPAPWPEHVGDVGKALAAFETDDDLLVAGSGPVAFGALPFETEAPARLLVPRVVAGSVPEGIHWLTRIGEDDIADTQATLPSPRAVRLEATSDAETWCARVEMATRIIREQRVDKVVLARTLVVHADGPFDPVAIGADLARRYPHSLRFCVDGFVGASPELLVSRLGDVVRAVPMAGTTPRTGEPLRDAAAAASLLASAKNRAEHQITVEVVHERLLPWCSYLDIEPEPHVAPAGPVQHLATLLEGRLSSPPPSVLDLVAALHPTPAVGGSPTSAALEVITRLEDARRGRYAGPVGWVDRHGNGAFAVGIRSVEVAGTEARISAGVGVVADSDPAAELEECRAKFDATLPSVIRL
jgi:isochorismate synthase